MKNKNVLGFAIFYVASVALIILYFTFLKDKSSAQKTNTETAANTDVQKPLLIESDSLIDQLKKLQKLDERYSALFVQSKVTPAMDSIDTEISAKEYIFNNIIDSFEKKNNAAYTGPQKELYKKITDYFKQSLENRRTIGNIRYALAAGNFDLDSGQQRWLKLHSDLILKDNRIEELEKQLATNTSTSQSSVATADHESNLSLRDALSDEQKKNETLANANRLLKQSVNSLNTDLIKYRNGTSKNNNTVSAEDNSTKKMVEDLNAEIQLAKVDCNLSRADVKQIISNSRQRKELLSDALKVLNDLSNSQSADIRTKTKQRLTELHRITETVRD